jgi:O-antigen/teichoic acid export membrane protein
MLRGVIARGCWSKCRSLPTKVLQHLIFSDSGFTECDHLLNVLCRPDATEKMMMATFSAFAAQARQAALLLRFQSFDCSTPQGRAQERHRRLVLSAGAAAAAKLFSVGAALISVPLTLHYLGQERYGMWMTMTSLIAMLSFADLGMGNGILNAVADSHGRDDRQSIRCLVASGFFILTIIAAVILILFAGVYRFVHWFEIFNVKSELAQQEAGPALAVFATCFALAIPLGIVQRVQMGLQQGFTASLWQCLGSVLGLIGILLVIRLEGGLRWLVVALAGAPLIAGLMNSIFFFAVMEPDIAPKARFVSRHSVARIARTGLLFLVLQIVVAVAYGSDNIVIAQMLGPAAVAEYAVPQQMFSLIGMVLAIGLAPLWPAYGEAIARGDKHWVTRTLKHSLLVSIGISALMSAILVLFGTQLIGIWVGHSINPTLLLLLGLGLWKVLEAGGNALAMFLNGAHVVKLQVFLASIFAVASIAMKLYLVGKIGVSGAVWATVVTYLVFCVVPYVLYVPQILLRSPKLHH